MHQEDLWHESFEDALRATVDALGGPKRVASELWPAKTIGEAARFLNHCLDADRAEKLHLHEVLWVVRRGRAAGCHVVMGFLAGVCDYEPPVPKDAQTELMALQHEYIKAAKAMGALAQRIEYAQVRTVSDE